MPRMTLNASLRLPLTCSMVCTQMCVVRNSEGAGFHWLKGMSDLTLAFIRFYAKQEWTPERFKGFYLLFCLLKAFPETKDRQPLWQRRNKVGSAFLQGIDYIHGQCDMDTRERLRRQHPIANIRNIPLTPHLTCLCSYGHADLHSRRRVPLPGLTLVHEPLLAHRHWLIPGLEQTAAHC